MNDQTPPTLEEMIAGFPAFVIGVILGLFKAAITETDLFLVVVWGVLLALLTSPLVGIVAALGLYLIFRTIVSAAGAVSRNLAYIGQVMRDKDGMTVQAVVHSPQDLEGFEEGVLESQDEAPITNTVLRG